ncbi:unnamed protein product [Rotaria sp. Silwood2]|nr:unnamed protein product [Rotaria sp. Silwood2]CAF4438992.1 unnamed protein product [Rotaria sp. Silwood2]
MELESERAWLRSGQAAPSTDELPLSMDVHWRNVMIGLQHVPVDEQKFMVDAYRDYILEGNPFEILDGDNFEMAHELLNRVFESFSGKKMFVISALGPQNSGKSTLMNFLFGASFEARDGRCTKGEYF